MAAATERKGVLAFLTKGVAATQKDIKGIDKSLMGVKKTTTDLDKGQQAQEKTTKSQMAGWAKGLGAVAAGYVTLTAVRKAFAAAEHAADIQNIEKAFVALTGSQGIAADTMMASMKAATRGTITEMELMVQANQAAMLGIDLGQFDKMMEIARSASLATGQSMDFMLQSIVTGVGRQSKMILDNLGIVFDLETAYRDYALVLGTTADKLTEGERKQAFMNAAMEAGIANASKMGMEGTTAAEEFDRLKAATKDLGATLADYLVSPLSQAAGFVANIVAGVEKTLDTASKHGAGAYWINPQTGNWELKGAQMPAWNAQTRPKDWMAWAPGGQTEAEVAAAKEAADLMERLNQSLATDQDMPREKAITFWGEYYDGVVMAAYGLDQFASTMAETEAYQYSFTKSLVSGMADVEFATNAVGDAFAGLIMGNKLALQEGLKVIAAEAAGRLKAIASEASVEALWQTAQGIGAAAWGNFAKAGVHFKAAGAAAAAAAAAGMAAGAVSRTVGVGESFGLGGGGGSARGAGAVAGGMDTGRSRETVNVTRTAPSTVNIAIYNQGPVYYASEAHVTAQALTEVLESGEILTPEQEVA